jgi:DNA-binding CsgD family transcriptional regulator
VNFEDYLSERDAPVTLARRHLECLRYRSHGLTYRQTAEAMNLTPGSVLMYLKYAREELRAKSTTHACCIALRLGLID